MAKISMGMGKRVKEGWGEHKRDRYLLNQYDLILANCGVRLIILVKGKTGIREVVCNKGTVFFY
jgi:hypothetical protein